MSNFNFNPNVNFSYLIYILLGKAERMALNDWLLGLWRGVKARKPSRDCYMSSGMM
jgi:hypothetical protein